MEQLKLRIPAAFVLKRTRMRWREVLFGLANELLDPAAPVDLAAAQMTEEASNPPTLIELAASNAADPTRGLVETLAPSEPMLSEEEVRDKWLCLVLAWLFEHRHNYRDPLELVEEVYADFGYPEQLAGFVRSMPMEGPDLGSRAQNEARLLERWRRFVEACEARLSNVEKPSGEEGSD